jgi:hypothetical protein
MLHALGLVSEAAKDESTSGQKQHGPITGKKKRKAGREAAAPGHAQTLEETEVDLHDMDITMPDFEVGACDFDDF